MENHQLLAVFNNDFIEKFAKNTTSIPLINSLKPEVRLLILETLFFGVLVLGMVYLIPGFQK